MHLWQRGRSQHGVRKTGRGFSSDEGAERMEEKQARQSEWGEVLRGVMLANRGCLRTVDGRRLPLSLRASEAEGVERVDRRPECAAMSGNSAHCRSSILYQSSSASREREYPHSPLLDSRVVGTRVSAVSSRALQHL